MVEFKIIWAFYAALLPYERKDLFVQTALNPFIKLVQTLKNVVQTVDCFS